MFSCEFFSFRACCVGCDKKLLGVPNEDWKFPCAFFLAVPVPFARLQYSLQLKFSFCVTGFAEPLCAPPLIEDIRVNNGTLEQIHILHIQSVAKQQRILYCVFLLKTLTLQHEMPIASGVWKVEYPLFIWSHKLLPLNDHQTNIYVSTSVFESFWWLFARSHSHGSLECTFHAEAESGVGWSDATNQIFGNQAEFWIETSWQQISLTLCNPPAKSFSSLSRTLWCNHVRLGAHTPYIHDWELLFIQESENTMGIKQYRPLGLLRNEIKLSSGKIFWKRLVGLCPHAVSFIMVCLPPKVTHV